MSVAKRSIGLFLAVSVVTLFVGMPVVPSAHAQDHLTENTYRTDKSDRPGTLDLEDATWLIGTWTGTGFGGTVEEVWLPAAHGQMVGLFRHYTGDEPGFSEILTLGESGEGGTRLRVKHFSSTFEGWEARDESVDFRFIRADPEALYFSGLTLRREEGDVLKIYIAMSQQNGTVEEAVLEYRRAPS